MPGNAASGLAPDEGDAWRRPPSPHASWIIDRTLIDGRRTLIATGRTLFVARRTLIAMSRTLIVVRRTFAALALTGRVGTRTLCRG